MIHLQTLIADLLAVLISQVIMINTTADERDLKQNSFKAVSEKAKIRFIKLGQDIKATF